MQRQQVMKPKMKQHLIMKLIRHAEDISRQMGMKKRLNMKKSRYPKMQINNEMLNEVVKLTTMKIEH
jgi:hypothetical protein